MIYVFCVKFINFVFQCLEFKKIEFNVFLTFDLIDIFRFFLGFWYTDTHTIKLTSDPITLTLASQIRKEFFVKQKSLHYCCTRNALEVLQHRSFLGLLSWSSAFDLYKYDSKWAIFDVDCQAWKKSFLKLFQKFKVLMFFDERTLNFTSLLIFLVPARRRSSKSEKLQKALLSDLIINVKYRSFWVILVEIESAWSAQ
jgi:hypothetical protein